MEGGHSMEEGHSTDRTWEEQHLKQTLEVVEHNLEHYSQETKRMQAEIDVMLEHYHDNDVELWTLLNNTITLNEHMKMALKRNEKAKEKPYFGRIIFRDETLGVEESLYIGKGGISKDSTHQVVVDWRAPVANAYYENGLGKCSYQAPDGKELPIDLKLKRTYEITGGKLTDYFDTEVVANDDLLMKYLSKNKQAVLGEIVATIQKEQNEIIRKSPYHNVIVQGVAGSGKTTVAMHRISFILYNYQERFRPEDFYIVGSNRILLNYITGVLPDLDVYGVRQMTMEQLFIRLLYEDWDEKKYHVRLTGGANKASHDSEALRYSEAVKGTEGWYRELIGFIRRLERESISLESIYLNPRQFVEGLRGGKSGVYDMTEEDEAQSGNMELRHEQVLRDGQELRSPQLVELVSGDAVARYVSQNPNISIQSKINMLNERLLIKVRDEFTGKGIKYTESERKAILKAYRGRYGGREWKKPIFEIYREFLKEQRDKGYKIQIPSDGFDVYDLAALALIYKLVKETEVISEAHHIVIDEAQDFGMFVYRVLHACIKDCTYTIMGDVSQNIHFGYGLNDWEELRSLLLAKPQDSFGVLKKSYRNTVEISGFATNILRHGSFSVYPVEPIIRHGAEVTVEKVNTSGEGSMEELRKSGDADEFSVEKTPDFVRRAADICRGWQQKGYDTIAVVCRDGQTAEEAACTLSRHIDIMESDLEKADFGSGIMVLPVEYTKGLEFDAVLIWNPTREDYPVDDGHARLLYVAATRALHELCVLHSGNLTGLIADPVPDKPVMSAIEDNSWYSEKEASHRNEASRQKEDMHHKSAVKKPVLGELHNVTSYRNVNPQHNAVSQQKENLRSNEVLKNNEAAQHKKTLPDNETLYHFGDIPPTEKLRPTGHSKINLSVKWCSKQEDGLYLPSQYGTLRICPVGSGIVRITFAKGAKITEGRHPLIVADRMEKNWKYRDNGKVIEVLTGELLLQVDKSLGAISYMTPEKKLLLAERRQECRLIDNQPQIDNLPQTNSLSPNSALAQMRGSRSWLFLDWQKGEQLFALGPEGQSALSLKGTARIISYQKMPGGEAALPFILSDRGYGLLPAATGTTFTCDIPAYGSYLYMETAVSQMDYYVIAGKQQRTIMGAYAYLCGLL